MEKFREIGSFNDPLSYDYWNEYYLRLLNYIDYYKKSVDDKPTEENINYNIEVEFYHEKLAALYGELDRVKTIKGVLKYKYETDEI